MNTQQRTCPKCGLISPSTTERCDCGYDFAAGVSRRPQSAPAPVRPPTVTAPNHIVLTDIAIPFPAMVRIFFLWTLASIPTLILFAAVGFGLGLLVGSLYYFQPTIGK